MAEVAKTATYTHAYAESNGFLTLLSDGERLTGAYALGPEAGEWLQQATLAIRARVPLDVLRDTIQPFPTFSEIYVDALKALRGEIAARCMRRAAQLNGQTVVVIGGSAGIGLETARLARAEGADVILTGRDPERLEPRRARSGAGAPRPSTPPTATASSGSSPSSAPIDHVMVTGGGPYYAPLAEMDFAEARRDVDGTCGCRCASPATQRQDAARRHAAVHRRHRRTQTWRRPDAVGALTAAAPALTANLALELAPVRVNLSRPGSSTRRCRRRCSATSSTRGASSCATLPIGRVVGPDDVAALAVHLMSNTALTGATYDIDGGQQLV